MFSVIVIAIMGILLAALFVGRAIEVLLPRIRERREEKAPQRVTGQVRGQSSEDRRLVAG